jgi:bacterioferritin-associated ferredoxin
MYVCICNTVTEKDIQQAVKQGVSSLEMLSENMQVSNDCGCCADHASKVLAAAINEQAYDNSNT